MTYLTRVRGIYTPCLHPSQISMVTHALQKSVKRSADNAFQAPSQQALNWHRLHASHSSSLPLTRLPHRDHRKFSPQISRGMLRTTRH